MTSLSMDTRRKDLIAALGALALCLLASATLFASVTYYSERARDSEAPFTIRIAMVVSQQPGGTRLNPLQVSVADASEIRKPGDATAEEPPGEATQTTDKHGGSVPKALAEGGARKASPSITGILGVDFDLDRPANAPESIVNLRKRVRANGVATGDIQIRVINDTRIMVRASEIGAVLTAQGEAKKANARSVLGSDEYVDFDRIRASGVSISYDPIRDMIVIDS